MLEVVRLRDCLWQFKSSGAFYLRRDLVEKIVGGYIIIARKLLESPSWGALNDAGKVVMITLLMLANHKEKSWYNPLLKKEVVIKRGQCIIGRNSLAEKSGVSVRSVRTCINTLKTTKFMTIKPTKMFSFVTINNYNTYQNHKNYTDQVNDHQSDQAPTKHRPQLINDNTLKEYILSLRNEYCKLKSVSPTNFSPKDYARLTNTVKNLRQRRDFTLKSAIERLNALSKEATGRYSWTFETLDKKWLDLKPTYAGRPDE